jgi:ABC-2 type transport system ATP-binding protein
MMKRRVVDRLRSEARQGRTILLTTQVLSEAEELCDTIMILDQGRTMAAGSLQELRKQHTQTHRVSLSFAAMSERLRARLAALHPRELKFADNSVEMLFLGNESTLLMQLAEISREDRIVTFEVRGATLEDIFMHLVQARH